jgi:hypothetical protein
MGDGLGALAGFGCRRATYVAQMLPSTEPNPGLWIPASPVSPAACTRVADLAPPGDLVRAVDTGGANNAMALVRDLGAFGHDEASGRPLNIVFAMRSVGISSFVAVVRVMADIRMRLGSLRP